MTKKEFLESVPTYSEFKEEIEINFSNLEKSFQTNMAVKVGLKNWENYLTYMYEIFTEIIDVEGSSNEFLGDMIKEKKIVGDINSNFKKHLNKNVESKIDEIILRTQEFSTEDLDKIGKVEIKIMKSFYKLIFDKIKYNEKQMNAFHSTFSDLAKQTKFDFPLTPNSYQIIFEYFESYRLPTLNTFISSASTPNFYFNDKKHLLKDLHDKLASIGAIKPNGNFEKIFTLKHPNFDEVQKIKWTGKFPNTHLFYLLFILNNKSHFIDGMNLTQITFTLFEFEKESNNKSLTASYHRVRDSFDDKFYVERNLKIITQILKELNLV